MNVGGVLGTERIGWPLPIPRFSTVGWRGVGTMLGPRVGGALGWVPCMLLGLARRIGLL
jgi:hypothetical protein